MLFTLVSLILIAVATGYLLLFIHRNTSAQDTAAKIALIAATMLSGAAFGIVAVQALDYRLSATLLAAGVFVAAAGACTIKRMGIGFAVNAFLAGALAAIGGVAFGMLLVESVKVVFVADVLLVVLLYLLQKAVEQRATVFQARSAPSRRKSRKPHNNSAQRRFSSYAPAVVLAVLVVLAGSLLAKDKDDMAIGHIGRPATQLASLDEDNNLQTAVIAINASGFNPPNTSFTAGTMAKIVFRVDAGAGTNLTLVSETLGINAPLKTGDNMIVIKKPLAGTYAFQVENSSFAGTITVAASGADSGQAAAKPLT